MTDIWSPSTDYSLGALVIPRTAATVVQEALTNAGFESGDSGWTKGTGWTISNGSAYVGSWKASRDSTAGTSLLENNNIPPCAPGQVITVGAAIWLFGAATARIGIRWLDSLSAEISVDYGVEMETSGLAWKQASHTATAPVGTAFLQLVVEGTSTGGGLDVVKADASTWNYAYIEIPSQLFYEATVAGTAGTIEPVWPTVAGNTVFDGGVTWTARAKVSITWVAKPILKSGAVEPVWPTIPQGLIDDNGISWKAVTRHIEDDNCPNTKAVVKAASKIYAEDDEIIRFSATVNCKDWTTQEDAGYLPTGLQYNGINKTSVLGSYRGNLTAFSADGFQMWGVDEDPAANALIDKMDGIGSLYHRACCSVGNEQYFLTGQGVRTVGIAVGSTNLQAGDIGMPIDPLVKAALLAAIAGGIVPLSFYFPGAGQYWLVLGAEIFVYTMNKIGSIGAWSRYVYPFLIEDSALLGSDLFVRDGDSVRRITDTVEYDEIPNGEVEAPWAKQYFDAVVQWAHLDFGTPGKDKEMIGFDIVGTGIPTVQFGWNQKDATALTPAYVVDEDTLTDDIIAMPLTAPTISVKITYVGAEGKFWQLNSVNLYFAD